MQHKVFRRVSLIILGNAHIIELQLSLQLNGFMFYDSAVVSIRVRPEALSGFLHPLIVLQQFASM